MKKQIAFVLLLFLIGCSGSKQTYSIADVTKPEAIALKKLRSHGNIHYLTVVGTGHIEGTGEITLILNGKPYKTESLSGDVQFTWADDWYAVSAEIEFEPTSVKSGELSLQYKFKDF